MRVTPGTYNFMTVNNQHLRPSHVDRMKRIFELLATEQPCNFIVFLPWQAYHLLDLSVFILFSRSNVYFYLKMVVHRKRVT